MLPRVEVGRCWTRPDSGGRLRCECRRVQQMGFVRSCNPRGARRCRGERISTAVVESMVNRLIERRMTKKQSMRWSRRGAHRLIQVQLAARTTPSGASTPGSHPRLTTRGFFPLSLVQFTVALNPATAAPGATPPFSRLSATRHSAQRGFRHSVQGRHSVQSASATRQRPATDLQGAG